MSKPATLIGKIDHSGIPLLLARLGVGIMFGYMAIMKLVDPVAFLKEVHEYGILPTQPPIWLNLTAVAVPWTELICAIALILGLGTRGAALIINGMLVFFTPMLIWRALGILNADPELTSFCDVCFDCGCGTGVVCMCQKIPENLALQVGALIALFSHSKRFTLDAVFAHWWASPAKT